MPENNTKKQQRTAMIMCVVAFLIGCLAASF